MLIEKFFENREIFITGGSGFIGKALIEKLLRSCPNVGKIYVLLREKKGKSAQERLNAILETSLFNRLRQEQPQTLKNVIAIAGDSKEMGLGISATDLRKLQNVSIIYNSAASVRFDDHLRTAIILNVRGTHELVKIAEKLPKLIVFLHVSTTFCNPDKTVVEEEMYPPYADWRTTIQMAETYSEETLNIFNLKYGNNQPNTYTFTKSLSEQLINDYKQKLPMIILRPSVVVSTVEEPVPGWIDNFNGPIGLLVASGVGIHGSSYGDANIVTDFVPVDVVVRVMLVATYKEGITSIKDTNHLPIYNCAAASVCPITQGEMLEMGKRLIKENPYEKTLWAPGGSITKCFVWHIIRFFLMHLLMAIFLDCVLRLVGQKPFMLKLQRRICAANAALHYFVTCSWQFKNQNCLSLEKEVTSTERKKFAFMHYANVDYDEFFRNAIKGSKEFLLNESAQCSKAGLLRFKILQTLNWLVKGLTIFLIIRWGLSFVL